MLFTWHGAHTCRVLLSTALITLYDLHMQQYFDVFDPVVLLDMQMLCMLQPELVAHAKQHGADDV